MTWPALIMEMAVMATETAIVVIYLIQGNTLFRAVQEDEYLDDAVLQGL